MFIKIVGEIIFFSNVSYLVWFGSNKVYMSRIVMVEGGVLSCFIEFCSL